MNTTLVSLEDYPETAYSPDREYVDGVVVERHVGERPHSTVLSNLVCGLRGHSDHVWPTLRVRTTATRIRVPDVCVTLEDPGTDILLTPPFICIEILSRGDTFGELLKKLEEYDRFGVPNIWMVDPLHKQAFNYQGRRLQAATSPALTTQDPAISIPLDEVFRGL